MLIGLAHNKSYSSLQIDFVGWGYSSDPGGYTVVDGGTTYTWLNSGDGFQAYAGLGIDIFDISDIMTVAIRGDFALHLYPGGSERIRKPIFLGLRGYFNVLDWFTPFVDIGPELSLDSYGISGGGLTGIKNETKFGLALGAGIELRSGVWRPHFLFRLHIIEQIYYNVSFSLLAFRFG